MPPEGAPGSAALGAPLPRYTNATEAARPPTVPTRGAVSARRGSAPTHLTQQLRDGTPEGAGRAVGAHRTAAGGGWPLRRRPLTAATVNGSAPQRRPRAAPVRSLRLVQRCCARSRSARPERCSARCSSAPAQLSAASDKGAAQEQRCVAHPREDGARAAGQALPVTACGSRCGAGRWSGFGLLRAESE